MANKHACLFLCLLYTPITVITNYTERSNGTIYQESTQNTLQFDNNI